MLTADLVVARRYKGELRLKTLEGEARARAVSFTEALVGITREHVGKSREELEAAWEGLPADDVDRRVALALRKLVLDGCRFEAHEGPDPVELRRELFSTAAAVRQALPEGAAFDREVVIDAVAQVRGLSREALEDGLFADLRSAETLVEPTTEGAAAIVARFPEAQAQATLLRATEVTCTVRSASAGVVRAFFRKLKFHRLLFQLAPLEDGGFRVTVDGPFSLFESVTRYGLSLAMMLPALAMVDSFSLEAKVLWGAERVPLLFRLEGGAGDGADASPMVIDEVEKLRKELSPVAATYGLTVALANDVIDLPGAGLVVPDLVVKRGPGKRVYVELLGFWSRDAVFQRVELVEKGLSERVVFCASDRLRVKEAILASDERASLYVYKGVPSPRKVMERVLRLMESQAGTLPLI